MCSAKSEACIEVLVSASLWVEVAAKNAGSECDSTEPQTTRATTGTKCLTRGVRLVNDTELVIAPKARQSQAEAIANKQHAIGGPAKTKPLCHVSKDGAWDSRNEGETQSIAVHMEAEECLLRVVNSKFDNVSGIARARTSQEG